MKKTIMEQMNDILEDANKLEAKFREDEEDKKDLEMAKKLFKEGEIDKETYDNIKKIYRRLSIQRWLE